VCLLTVIDLTEGNGQNQSLGTPFELSSFNPFSFIFLFSFFVLILLLYVVYVYTCMLRLVLLFFLCYEHVWLLELVFFVHALFSALCFWVRVLK